MHRRQAITSDWLPNEHRKVGAQKPKWKFTGDTHTQESLKPNSII